MNQRQLKTKETFLIRVELCIMNGKRVKLEVDVNIESDDLSETKRTYNQLNNWFLSGLIALQCDGFLRFLNKCGINDIGVISKISGVYKKTTTWGDCWSATSITLVSI